MTQEELKEKRERFRLYGEICLLMEEQDEDIFDLVTVSRCDMPLEHEIVVRIENGDSGDFRGIQFEDGMLWVMFGTDQIAFVCISSESLKEIYEALKNFLRRKDMSTSNCPYFSENAPVCDDGECGCFECMERIAELRKKGE